MTSAIVTALSPAWLPVHLKGKCKVAQRKCFEPLAMARVSFTCLYVPQHGSWQKRSIRKYRKVDLHRYKVATTHRLLLVAHETSPQHSGQRVPALSSLPWVPALCSQIRCLKPVCIEAQTVCPSKSSKLRDKHRERAETKNKLKMLFEL